MGTVCSFLFFCLYLALFPLLASSPHLIGCLRLRLTYCIHGAWRLQGQLLFTAGSTVLSLGFPPMKKGKRKQNKTTNTCFDSSPFLFSSCKLN